MNREKRVIEFMLPDLFCFCVLGIAIVQALMRCSDALYKIAWWLKILASPPIGG